MSKLIKWISAPAIIVVAALYFPVLKSNCNTVVSGESSISKNTDDIGIPAPLNDRSEQILVRRGYTTSYNADSKIPNWVEWHLTSPHCTGPYKRAGMEFQEDMDVPEGKRAVDWDYYNSGFDRGHMCPAGDNKWDMIALQQSFLFTNICPQQRNLNRGDWGESEKACRKWAKEFGDIYIVCGPILYRQHHKMIGKNRVVVPEAFFKVVLCLKGTPKAIGFIYKNTKGNNPLSSYVNSVDEVERITGIDFFPALPDQIENMVEATCDISDWPY